jgi:Skp family chaperone for outer membrane proteins
MEQDIGENDVQQIFNPLVGKYDVVVETGASYQTQRQEGFAALTELAGRNPAMMQVAGDIIMRAADFPMANELAERLAKTLPPELRDEKKGQEQISPEVQQKITQMNEQMQMMDAELQDAHAQLQQAQQGNQAKAAQSQADLEFKTHQSEIEAQLKAQQLDAETQAKLEQARLDSELAIEKAHIDSATKIEVAKINVQSNQEIELMKAALVDMPPNKEQAPVKATRKVITVQAPSGAIYQGSIEDEPMESEDYAEYSDEQKVNNG